MGEAQLERIAGEPRPLVLEGLQRHGGGRQAEAPAQHRAHAAMRRHEALPGIRMDQRLQAPLLARIQRRRQPVEPGRRQRERQEPQLDGLGRWPVGRPAAVVEMPVEVGYDPHPRLRHAPVRFASAAGCRE